MHASESEIGAVRFYLETVVTGLTHFGNTKPKGFKYLCVPDYILRNGRDYTYTGELTPEEIELLSRIEMWPQQCFSNCQRALVRLRDPGIVYVEGHAICGHTDLSLPLPLPHAWLEVNGKLYDPTWSLSRTFAVEKSVFFGVPFTVEDVEKHIRDTEEYSQLIDDWTHGFPLLKE